MTDTQAHRGSNLCAKICQKMEVTHNECVLKQKESR